MRYDQMTRRQKEKARAGLCIAHSCGNEAGEGRNLCYKHKRRVQKQNNPRRYCFDLLRQNAKRRGKEFTLTFEEFCQFSEETGYMDKKGKTCRKFSIDRKDVTKGYSYGNIQVLTVSANSKKRHEEYADCPF